MVERRGEQTGTTMADQFDLEWHLEHSQPELFTDYTTPHALFDRQLNMLRCRYHAVRPIAMRPDVPEPVRDLRNSLAFHLFKTAHWWGVRLSASDVLGEPQGQFMAFATAHARKNPDDELFLDAASRKTNGTSARMAIVLRQMVEQSPVCIGLDIMGDYHSGFVLSPTDVRWCDYSREDYVAAWLDAQIVSSRPMKQAYQENWERAGDEHALCRPYIRDFFARHDVPQSLAGYRAALATLRALRSGLARAELDRVVNTMAYRVVSAMCAEKVSSQRSISPACHLQDATEHADMISRCLVYRAVSADPYEWDHIDRIMACILD